MRLGRIEGADRHSAPLWPPLLATRAPGGQSGLHAHHAMHFVVAVNGEIAVQAGGDAAPRRAAGLLTAPDAAHAIDARGCDVLLVFLDPEGLAGALLRGCFEGEVRTITHRERLALLRDADPREIMQKEGVDWIRRAAEALGVVASATPPKRVHPKVRKLLRLLGPLSAEGPVSLEEMARAVELSPSRLMHVFTDSVGLPPRPYLAWLKLQRAAGAIVSGAPLAEAAHRAGFSDAAHMCRAFRHMFGVTPSSLRPNVPAS